MALSVHRFSDSLQPWRRGTGYPRFECPRPSGIVVNRLNPLRTAFIAGTIILGTCRAGGQTPPLRDPSVAQKTLAPLSATDPVVQDGLFSIDVVVTDAAGNPVTDLAPGDFTLLDNGQPAKIRTLHNSLAPLEPAPELIFVVDAVNLSPRQAESAIVHFLRRNNGRQEAACFLYRLTRDGLFSSSKPTRDGNMLIKEVEQHKSPRTVWRSGRNDGPSLLRAWESISQPNPLSLRALGSIAIDQREIAGRKVVIWIGPGWPVLGVTDSDFDEITELSTRLREARITLDNVTEWPNPDQSFDYHNYLEAPRSKKDMQPAKMALQVIAAHTGGLVLESSGDIQLCVKEERSFYTLTFNPPHTSRMDDYRDLRVEVRTGVGRPALIVRAPTGYFNEPVYFDNPRPGIEKVTVAQLEELVHARTDLLRKLTNLELVERLSTARLDALLSVIHSERERQALTADADLSLALVPPADEIVDRPPPQVEEQRAILGRTFEYLQNAIPKLPDFYALRKHGALRRASATRRRESGRCPHAGPSALHFANGEHATVLYRNGNEEVEKKQKLRQ